MNSPSIRFTTTLAFLLAGLAEVAGEVVIVTPPAGASVSLGADVVFSVMAVSALPISYQWRKGVNDLPGETTDILVLAGVQTTAAGSYTVVASDTSGSVTSQVATLTVDPAFTKITQGDIVNDGATSWAAGWGDYDNDGFLDLFLVNYGQNNQLFHNNGDGTFTRILTGALVEEAANSTVLSWGDYDNDGFLDVFVGNYTNHTHFLFHNNGNSTFSRVTNGPPVTDSSAAISGTWGDYDGDGFLDLFVANDGVNNDSLYHNNGNGTFTRVTVGPEVMDGVNSQGSLWVDYDGDGDLDLFVAAPGNELLYRNDDGVFTRITNSVLTTSGGNSISGAWGDYDNDGDLDVFVANYNAQASYLFRNDGAGAFTRILSSGLDTDIAKSGAATWADFDNDGWLDLFVANDNQRNFLYHNNGDGTFTKVTTGSIANDIATSFAASWGDYDNNGFLDLYVSVNGGNNFLYRNNGNSNHWLKVKLVGTASNRAGLGAKVRVNAVLGGTTRWQLRQTPSTDGFGGGTQLAEFGLGDATNISTLRIEWPSGLVQELHTVAVDQQLTVTETGFAIARQPRDLFVFPGRNATNTVRAASDQPLSYQWRCAVTNLPGQTNATLILTNVQPSQEGDYTVLVSNGVTSLLSAPGRLTVVINPVITLAPAINLTNVAGTSITLGAAIAGSPPPFFYLWRSNSLAIRSNFNTFATTDFITVTTPSTPGMSNTYRLEVTNRFSTTLVSFTNRVWFTNHTVADSDGDGLPDYYENAYGPGGVMDPLGDADGDTMNNLAEYLAGTNPTNAASFLKVDAIGLANGGTAARIAFLAAPNKTYTVESRAVVNTGGWVRIADVVSATTNRGIEILDPISPGEVQRYYRLVTPRRP